VWAMNHDYTIFLSPVGNGRETNLLITMLSHTKGDNCDNKKMDQKQLTYPEIGFKGFLGYMHK
ncbi:hypothetical protein MAR_019008, partial [Mya arenaria]